MFKVYIHIHRYIYIYICRDLGCGASNSHKSPAQHTEFDRPTEMFGSVWTTCALQVVQMDAGFLKVPCFSNGSETITEFSCWGGNP